MLSFRRWSVATRVVRDIERGEREERKEGKEGEGEGGIEGGREEERGHANAGILTIEE